VFHRKGFKPDRKAKKIEVITIPLFLIA